MLIFRLAEIVVRKVAFRHFPSAVAITNRARGLHASLIPWRADICGAALRARCWTPRTHMPCTAGSPEFLCCLQPGHTHTHTDKTRLLINYEQEVTLKSHGWGADVLTSRMVKFSSTLFIMYFSGRCLSLWTKLIMYSHIGERLIL